MKSKLRAYFWEPCKDSEWGIAVIAPNLKEAKKIGYNYWGSEHGHDEDFIEQNCYLIKGKPNIKGLKKGIYDNFQDGLIRGLYGQIFNTECGWCHAEQEIISEVLKDIPICYDCLENQQAIKQKQKIGK